MRLAQWGVVTVSMTVLTGCGSLNSSLAERQESVEIYHVWDLKTSAAPDQMIRGLTDGIARNTNSINSNRPLRVNPALPAEPGKFQIVDGGAMLQNTGLGAMLSMSGSAGVLKSARCDDAIWSSVAVRNVTGSDSLRLYTCLYAYKGGYSINQYAYFTKQSGGLMQIAREASQAMVGTPEEWLNKTIVDAVRGAEKAASASARYVEGQPVIGSLPAVDAVIR